MPMFVRTPNCMEHFVVEDDVQKNPVHCENENFSLGAFKGTFTFSVYFFEILKRLYRFVDNKKKSENETIVFENYRF